MSKNTKRKRPRAAELSRTGNTYSTYYRMKKLAARIITHSLTVLLLHVIVLYALTIPLFFACQADNILLK